MKCLATFKGGFIRKIIAISIRGKSSFSGMDPGVLALGFVFGGHATENADPDDSGPEIPGQQRKEIEGRVRLAVRGPVTRSAWQSATACIKVVGGRKHPLPGLVMVDHPLSKFIHPGLGTAGDPVGIDIIENVPQGPSAGLQSMAGPDIVRRHRKGWNGGLGKLGFFRIPQVELQLNSVGPIGNQKRFAPKVVGFFQTAEPLRQGDNIPLGIKAQFGVVVDSELIVRHSGKERAWIFSTEPLGKRGVEFGFLQADLGFNLRIKVLQDKLVGPDPGLDLPPHFDRLLIPLGCQGLGRA